MPLIAARTHFSSISSTFEKGALPEATCEPPYRSARRPNSVCLGTGAGVDIERELAQRLRDGCLRTTPIKRPICHVGSGFVGLIGAIAGWLAGQIVKGTGFGLVGHHVEARASPSVVSPWLEFEHETIGKRHSHHHERNRDVDSRHRPRSKLIHEAGDPRCGQHGPEGLFCQILQRNSFHAARAFFAAKVA